MALGLVYCSYKPVTFVDTPQQKKYLGIPFQKKLNNTNIAVQ